MNKQPTTAERSRDICGLFESEVLLWLLLKKWKHPHCDNKEFRNELLERAADVLDLAVQQPDGPMLIEDIPRAEMNFIAAVWCAEWCAVEDDARQRDLRRDWLVSIQRALPSCFCNPEQLFDA